MVSLIEKIKNIDWVAPESVIIFYIIFLLLALLSFKLGIVKFQPGFLGIFAVLFSFVFFAIGLLCGKFFSKIKTRRIFPAVLIGFLTIFYSFVLRGFYEVEIFILLPIMLVAFSGLYYLFTKIMQNEQDFRKFFKILLAISFIALPLSFFEIGGIPLQNFALRPKVLESIFAGAAFLLFFLAYSNLLPRIKNKRNAVLIIVLSTILFSLLAFRAHILIIFLTGALILYYNNMIDKKKLIIPFLAAILIIILAGYMFRPLLPPHELLLHRAGTTYVVYDKIANNSLPSGLYGGTLFFKGETGNLMNKMLFGKQGSITATLIGPAVLDLGLIGVAIWMFFIGFILNLAYKLKNIENFKGYYPLLFVTTLIMIETGLNPFYILFFFIFLLTYFSKKESL